MGEEEKTNTENLRVNLNDFDKDILLDIKEVNDKYHGNKEWLGHIYYKDGKYYLGQDVTGDYNGITIEPAKQMATDGVIVGVKECARKTGESPSACRQMVSSGSGVKYGVQSFGTTAKDLVATIHLHPMKNAGEYEKRSKFSGIDIGSEFAKSRDEDKLYRLFLTYPKFKGRERHNMLKMINFPGTKQVMSVMKTSNPQLSEEDIMSVTREGENIDTVDWHRYQDEAQKRGHIQEIDIENKSGLEAYSAEGKGYMWVVGVGTVLALAGAWLWNRHKKKLQ